MKAAVLHGPRDLRVEPVLEPQPGSDEVVVRVVAAGLCGTDYRIWTGFRAVTYPRIMGHEFVGVVDRVGPDVTRLSSGMRVVVEPNYSCGRCHLCLEGNRNLCLERTAVGIDVDGGFAELVRMPSRCCWPVPAGLADEDVLLTEPLAVVTRAINRGAPRAGETVALVGGGTLGLLALQVLRSRGARVLVVGRSPGRFELARQLGAEETHSVRDGGLEATARRFSGREGVDLVVETAGTPEAVEHALALVRPGGRVVLTGLPHAATSVAFFSVVRREITIMGSMIYQDEFPEALRLVQTGQVSARPLITHRFSLDAIGEAFVAHRDPTSIKVTIIPPRA
ncbi:MAG TPA: alcohol dehydrogenase catalytic domain-containing protein [Methylomirabilota bacterium]|nr:alcohol dehydrogenase catalytic domain-containing protein [Methylomirabilota bacterium]